MRSLLIAIILFLAHGVVNSVWAYMCSPYLGSGVLPGLPNTLYVSRDVGVNQLITSINVGNITQSCKNSDDGRTGTKDVFYRTTNAISGNMITPKGVVGIGYKVKVEEQSASYNQNPVSGYVAIKGNPLAIPLDNKSYPITANVTVEFYRLANNVSGTFSGEVFYLGADEFQLYTQPLVYTNMTYTFPAMKVVMATCTVNSSAITIPLGDVTVSEFKGIGPIANEKEGILGLSCDPGANVTASFHAPVSPDANGDDSIMALNGQGQAGTASGVGIQLLYKGQPVRLNQNMSLLKGSAGGTERLPVTARFYQTTENVGLGNANATATLNITYQ